MHDIKLLMIGNYLPPPKYNKNIWHYLAERLSRNGWQVITTSSKINKISRLWDMLWTIRAKRNDFTIAQLDVFSGQAFTWAELCAGFLKFLHKPVVLTLHGGALPEFSSRHPKRVASLLKKADLVVSPSPYLQQALFKFRPDIRLIPNPIDLSAAVYRHRERAQPRIIWLRSFHELYNPSLAIRVLKSLIAEFPDLQLLMIGPDKEDGSLQHVKNLSIELQVQSNLEIIKGIPHTQVPISLDKADIFLNTTNYDTAPRSLLEAMANGLCLVSTNVGGVPWLVEDGVNALLVPPNDVNAMATAVRRILLDPGLASTLSKNAHDHARSYDWSVILPQWEQLFNEVSEKAYGKV